MNTIVALQFYIDKMLGDTPGMKVLLLDQETVLERQDNIHTHDSTQFIVQLALGLTAICSLPWNVDTHHLHGSHPITPPSEGDISCGPH
jgi:hypothetical protein